MPMSSMLSAPAAIPTTNEQILAPALAPLSLGTLNRAWASSPRPARRARAITGTRPAADTRFGSSKTADTTVGVWKSRIYEMPFSNRSTELQTSPIVPVQRGILALPHPPGTLTHRWIQTKSDAGQPVPVGWPSMVRTWIRPCSLRKGAEMRQHRFIRVITAALAAAAAGLVSAVVTIPASAAETVLATTDFEDGTWAPWVQNGSSTLTVVDDGTGTN